MARGALQFAKDVLSFSADPLDSEGESAIAGAAEQLVWCWFLIRKPMVKLRDTGTNFPVIVPLLFGFDVVVQRLFRILMFFGVAVCSNLFVGLFLHKVFHTHHVDGRVLFLGFLDFD